MNAKLALQERTALAAAKIRQAIFGNANDIYTYSKYTFAIPQQDEHKKT